MSLKPTVYIGTFIHCKSLTELEIIDDGLIAVDEEGKIAAIGRGADEISKILSQPIWRAVEERLGNGQFLFPGFIDTHIHAPQFPNMGMFGTSTLIDWLNRYTFPLEADFRTPSTMTKVYHRVVRSTLANGTTTAAYFATAHVAATNLLADICESMGQRALIGRVCMNHLGPILDYGDESVEKCIESTKQCIEHVNKLDPGNRLITSIITPRFALSCSRDTLHALGQLHRETGLPIQTHLSETKPECDLVRTLFPSAPSYAGVYDEAGLLTSKTILAHCVHVTNDEIALMKKRGAKVAHCPVSNTAISSGFARVRKLLQNGLDVGLGTDVSGGYTVNMLEVIRQAIGVSKFIAMSEDDQEAKLSVEEGLWLATRGGAKVVGMQDKIGGFEVGMQFDAQKIQLATHDDDDDDQGAHVELFKWQLDWTDRVHKWVYGGDDRNVSKVWVNGALV